MKRISLLFTILAGCATTETPVEQTARFHGSVGNAVTHVMAVSPVAGDVMKVVSPTANGEFAVEVTAGRPWALVFINANLRGSDMVHGLLRVDTLDTLVPEAGGDVDLGKVSVDNREATLAGSSEALDLALGLSRRTLATLGGIDDLALRYANPDMDNDGVIDALQGLSPRLEMHAEYTVRASGRDATVEDFITNTAAISYRHEGTGIYARLPEGFGAVDREDADVTFDAPYYGYWQGEHTAAVPAGQPVSHLTFGDSRTFGVFCRPDQAIPAGTYTFRSGPHTLDFSFVRPPTEMTMHQVMPRFHFAPADPSCTKDCTLDRIEFSWARKTDAGWIVLTDEEAQVLQPVGSIDLIFRDGGTRRFELPIGYATGEVPWQHAIYTTQREYGSSDIVFGQLAFETRPGMKMYARFGDATVAPREVGSPITPATR